MKSSTPRRPTAVPSWFFSHSYKLCVNLLNTCMWYLFMYTHHFYFALSSLFHLLFLSLSVHFSSHFMLECSFISPALAVVIVSLALLTLDCFVNYVSTIPASSYGHDIVSQVRSACHLLPDVMETLIITAPYVKWMLDMSKIFSSPS